jgi:hypothetical protein
MTLAGNIYGNIWNLLQALLQANIYYQYYMIQLSNLLQNVNLSSITQHILDKRTICFCQQEICGLLKSNSEREIFKQKMKVLDLALNKEKMYIFYAKQDNVF